MVLLETKCHGWVVTHSTCFVGICTRSEQPMTQPVYWDAIQPSHIAPKLWDQIWQEDLYNHQAIPNVVYVVI